MKKAIAIIVAALFVLSFAAVSFAAEEKAAPMMEKKAPMAEEKKAPAKVKQVTGEVKAVDSKAMTLTVSKKMKEKAVETMVSVTDKTKITMGKEKKALADVKVGDKVTVKYTEADGKKMAKSIAIKMAEEKMMEPAAKPAAKPMEKK